MSRIESSPQFFLLSLTVEAEYNEEYLMILVARPALAQESWLYFTDCAPGSLAATTSGEQFMVT